MPSFSMPTLLTFAAILMIGVGVAGFGAVLLRSAAAGLKRRERLSGDTLSTSAPAASAGAFAQLADRIRRLGGRAEAQDPTQASALRGKLARAGFSAREAVAYYLGARSILLLVVTVATLMLAPMALSKSGGTGAMILAGLL